MIWCSIFSRVPARLAQAVLELNHEDGGNRQFICVQLPEPTGSKEFATIAEIGKQRIRRVIRKLNEDSRANWTLRQKGD